MVMAPIDRLPRPLPHPMPSPLPQSTDTLVDKLAFQMIDGNGDSAVSEQEWQKAGWTADRFEAFDGNGDGKVTQAEFQTARRHEREFNAKDRNGDGELSRLEMNGFHRFQAGIKGKVEGALGGAKDLVKHLPFPGQKVRFARFDADQDGSVSKAEYMAGRRKEENWIRPTPLPGPILRPMPMPKPMPMPGKLEDLVKTDVKAEKTEK